MNKKDISDFIRHLVKKYNKHPYDINDGLCENFGCDVCEEFGTAEGFWGDEILKWFPPSLDSSCHYFIKVGNRFYDAEEPEGVLSPAFLPFFVRNMTGEELLEANQIMSVLSPELTS